MMIQKRFQLKRKNIAIVQFIIEAYEGMATVSTIDPRLAIIQISIMKNFVSPMENVIEYLKNRYELEEIVKYPLNQ
jgi:transcriptional regulatory protein LevR